MIVRTGASALLLVGLLCGATLLHAEALRPISHDGKQQARPGPMDALVDYVQRQRTTGFLVIQNGHVMVERNWAAPIEDKAFASFAYERTKDGALLEDVASAQKSFVSVLVAIAIDKGLIDVDKPVSAYLGQGWSKASPEQEAGISLLDVLTMSSGLDERFAYAAPAGTRFFYNTPVYAITKRILTSASGRSLEDITRDC